MTLSIKAFIAKKLADLAITQFVYADDLPKDPRYPATVYSVIDSTPGDLTHDVGVVGFRKARVQLDVYALDFDEAEAAIEQYFETFKSFSDDLGDGQSPETFLNVDIWDEGQNPDMDFEDESTLKAVTGRSRDFMVHF
jgi:hypothetical protein